MPDTTTPRGEPPLDLLVIGAGLRGLCTARRAQREGARLLVVDRLPRPGGRVRTLRSEGFSCELGPFAFAADQLTGLLDALEQPPPTTALQPAAARGWRHAGDQLDEVAVQGAPRTGRGGCEDLVSAYRRELGPALRLGRAVTALRPGDELEGWRAALGGEVETELRARHVALCLPVAAAAHLLAPLDPGLHGAAEQLRTEPAALVFLGTWQDAHADQSLRGYGVLCEPPGMLREAIFCSNCFPRRAAPGKALVRLEVTPALAARESDDEALATAAEAELRRITGWQGTVLFRRVHRGEEPVRDGADTECRLRLGTLAERVAGLDWVAD